MKTRYPPGPWYYHDGVVMVDGNTYQEDGVTCGRPENERVICERIGSFDRMPQEMRDAIGMLLSAAPELDREARVLLALATEARFQDMTVRDALAELAASGRGHDGGAAVAKAEGDEWTEEDEREQQQAADYDARLEAQEQAHYRRLEGEEREREAARDWEDERPGESR